MSIGTTVVSPVARSRMSMPSMPYPQLSRWFCVKPSEVMSMPRIVWGVAVVVSFTRSTMCTLPLIAEKHGVGSAAIDDAERPVVGDPRCGPCSSTAGETVQPMNIVVSTDISGVAILSTWISFERHRE
jgi:hypothetical protein